MTPRELLLTRAGLVFLEPPDGAPAGAALAQGVALELAALGFAVDPALERALAEQSAAQLAGLRTECIEALARFTGAAHRHVPLFRRFPEGVPEDTAALWWSKVLVHFLQAPEQPCLFCGAVGTTHVLSPCRHVVCGRCWDGANYSGCPVCERAVDPGSPFFLDSPGPPAAKVPERVRFRRLSLGQDLRAHTRQLYTALCTRAQVMSPADVDALVAIVQAHPEEALGWLPEQVPVRENRAHVVGTLMRLGNPAWTLRVARAQLGTATDVLRVLAVYGGGSPSLPPARRAVLKRAGDRRWAAGTPTQGTVDRGLTQITTTAFRAPRLSRPLRRAVLELLDSLPAEALIEDMQRHAALWVRVGEVLHPFAWAGRYPDAARAFAAVRGTQAASPLGLRLAPGLHVTPRGRLGWLGFSARTERLRQAGDAEGLLRHLSARPGELARRLDALLRGLGDRPAAQARLLEGTLAVVPRLSTPMLLTLRAHFAARHTPLPVRVFFPKGAQFLAPSAPDRRPVYPTDLLDPLLRGLDAALLERLGQLPPRDTVVLDAALEAVPVPFNERTASRGAVQLPRGASLAVEDAAVARLFLHWCEPQTGGQPTDIDLSVGFYDADWALVDTCSYTSLRCHHDGEELARSAGDLRAAPWPDGASEFVDVLLKPARAAGLRYAVMVVNNYAGMAFSALERGFAGLMLRQDAGGAHFDARTVALRFAIDGDNGVFLPLIVDLAQRRLFWADVSTPGQLAFNNVATSNRDITRIGPALLGYFGAGVRPTLLELGRLHAAARARTVFVRGDRVLRFDRHPDEPPSVLLGRLRAGQADGVHDTLPALEGSTLAVLLRGDILLPEGAAAFAVLREGLTAPLAASDLLSTPVA